LNVLSRAMVASFRASSCWILAKSTLLPLIVLVVFVLRCECVSGRKNPLVFAAARLG
jgi:hypothetical protein